MTSPKKHSHSTPKANLRQTLAYALCSAINGGLVGVTGPSLHALGDATGLGQAALGRVVLINRICKLVGTFAWTGYAKWVAEKRAPIPPYVLMAVCSATIVLCAASIATYRESSLVLQVALAISGAAYGFSDSAIVRTSRTLMRSQPSTLTRTRLLTIRDHTAAQTLLTIWANRHPAQQRFHIAILNVGFTLGALSMPAVIAAALSLGLDCYVGFWALSLLGLISSCTLLGMRRAPAALPMPQPNLGASAVAAVPAGSNGRRGLTDVVMISCMAAVLFCVTGSEHAVATWLPTYGRHVGSLGSGELALMSAGFWAMICTGRVIWAAVAGALSSGFPALMADGVLMLVSAALIADFAMGKVPGGGGGLGGGGLPSGSALLWLGTLGLGFGCSSSLPCAITLPSEARVELTPVRLLALNLSGSAGEPAFDDSTNRPAHTRIVAASHTLPPPSHADSSSGASRASAGRRDAAPLPDRAAL